MKIILLNFLSLIFLACGNQVKETNSTQKELANAEPVEVPVQNGMKKAYFASGCFWCVEAVYESVQGVDEAISGYSGGHTKNPTYESSNTGRTGHAEAVEVIYDPEVVSFKTLVEVYFGSQNPTQVNGQGPDRGSQYRSIIFYQNDEQKNIIEEVKAKIAKNYQDPIAAEIMPFQKFWKAEDYHQDYEKNNPNNPYIRNVSIPRFNRFKSKFPDILKENQHSTSDKQSK
ncbi:MAG TPA: peptide-methionine (S)-S-oxide reductase MsrA [Christiangramia sp.]|nr:peptide-methionine (S)-S-oxide reductase MsrA [Christiangramia sp.]